MVVILLFFLSLVCREMLLDCVICWIISNNWLICKLIEWLIWKIINKIINIIVMVIESLVVVIVFCLLLIVWVRVLEKVLNIFLILWEWECVVFSKFLLYFKLIIFVWFIMVWVDLIRLENWFNVFELVEFVNICWWKFIRVNSFFVEVCCLVCLSVW